MYRVQHSDSYNVGPYSIPKFAFQNTQNRHTYTYTKTTIHSSEKSRHLINYTTLSLLKGEKMMELQT